MKNEKNLKYYTYELDMVYLNILSIVIFVLVSVIVFLIEKNQDYVTNINMGILFLLMIVWLMFHEVLHGIGFSIFPEVKKKNITFGIALEKGVFYCMCKQKISKKVILTSLLFPFTIIGVVTLIWGMIINSYGLVVLSILNIAGAVGDLVMVWYFLKVPNDVIYLDLDDCTSFTVLSKDDLSGLRLRGVRLKESGVYHDKMKALDRRRVVISKTSYVILGFIVFMAMIILLRR